MIEESAVTADAVEAPDREAVRETETRGGQVVPEDSASLVAAPTSEHPEGSSDSDEGLLSVSPDNALSSVRDSNPAIYGKRRGKRGTRGHGRPVGRSEVIYCSLEEELHAVVNDPTFLFTDKSVGDLYKQLMNIHQRAGCTIKLANGQVKQVQPREEMGQISTLVRAMCRLDNPVLKAFRQERQIGDVEELLDVWSEHYQNVDNSVGLSLRRRFALWQTKWSFRLFGNTARPPRC